MVSTSTGGIKPASQVVPSCPQTVYMQPPLTTGAPANILSLPSLLCFLPIHITPPWQVQMPSPPPQGSLAGKVKATSFYNRPLMPGEVQQAS